MIRPHIGSGYTEKYNPIIDGNVHIEFPGINFFVGDTVVMFPDAHGILRFGGIMPLFFILIIYNNHSHSTTYIHSSFTIRRACLLVSSSLLRSAREEPPWDAEPRIELGPATQQADALPTELRRNLTELRRIGCGPQFFGCLLRWLKPPL